MLRLRVISSSKPVNVKGLGRSMKTCERSWKVRPNCAVLMANLKGLLVVEPMLTLGFCSTGDLTPLTLHRNDGTYQKLQQQQEILQVLVVVRISVKRIIIISRNVIPTHTTYQIFMTKY